MKAGLFKSISEARKTIKAGGVYLNNARVEDEEQVLNENNFLHGRFALIRRGKKSSASSKMREAVTSGANKRKQRTNEDHLQGIQGI